MCVLFKLPLQLCDYLYMLDIHETQEVVGEDIKIMPHLTFTDRRKQLRKACTKY